MFDLFPCGGGGGGDSRKSGIDGDVSVREEWSTYDIPDPIDGSVPLTKPQFFLVKHPDGEALSSAPRRCNFCQMSFSSSSYEMHWKSCPKRDPALISATQYHSEGLVERAIAARRRVEAAQAQLAQRSDHQRRLNDKLRETRRGLKILDPRSVQQLSVLGKERVDAAADELAKAASRLALARSRFDSILDKMPPHQRHALAIRLQQHTLLYRSASAPFVVDPPPPSPSPPPSPPAPARYE